MILLYLTFIRPCLEFAAPVWSLFLSKFNSKLTAIRNLYYEKRLRKLKLTSLKDRKPRGGIKLGILTKLKSKLNSKTLVLYSYLFMQINE